MLRSIKKKVTKVFRRKKNSTIEPVTPEPDYHQYITDESSIPTTITDPPPLTFNPPRPLTPRPPTPIPSPQLQGLDLPTSPLPEHQRTDPEVDQGQVPEPLSPPSPHPQERYPYTPRYVPYMEASPLKNNMFGGSAGVYGRVNPDIMGGFGGDDESIWLVDDEETDEDEQWDKGKGRDNSSQLEQRTGTQSSNQSQHTVSSSSRSSTSTHQKGSGPSSAGPARPTFSYHRPAFLDDDFTSCTTSTTLSSTPLTPPTPTAPFAPRRGYTPVSASILDLGGLDVRGNAVHSSGESSSRPSRSSLPAVASTSSFTSNNPNNPYVALLEQQDQAMTMSYLRQVDQSREEVTDDFRFGQRYHKASDSSDVAITHQRTPASTVTGELDCIICTDSKGVDAFPRFSITSSCTHAPHTCLECIQLSIESDLSSKLWTNIRCPECRELLEYSDIQRYANKQSFLRYETLAIRAAMSEAENFVWCTSGCGSGQIHESGSEQPIVICLHCRSRSCFHHRVAWHETLSCDEYDQLLADPDNFRSRLEIENEQWSETQRAQLEADRAMAQNMLAEEQAEMLRREERARQEREQAQKAAQLIRQIAARRKKEEEKSQATLTRTTKPCPGCGWAIEKNRGCAHITCIKCRYEFCWSCNAVWNRSHNINCQDARH